MAEISAINRLITVRASQLMVERSDRLNGPFGLMAGMCGRIADGGMQSDLREADSWVRSAIRVLRAAPDVHWDSDEAAAQAIIDHMAVKFPQLFDRASPRQGAA